MSGWKVTDIFSELRWLHVAMCSGPDSLGTANKADTNLETLQGVEQHGFSNRFEIGCNKGLDKKRTWRVKRIQVIT